MQPCYIQKGRVRTSGPVLRSCICSLHCWALLVFVIPLRFCTREFRKHYIEKLFFPIVFTIDCWFYSRVHAIVLWVLWRGVLKMFKCINTFQVIKSPMSDVRLINGGGLLVCEWIKDLGEVIGTVSGHAGHVSETSKVRAIFAVHRSAQGELYRDLFSIHPCFMAYHPTV